MMDNGGILLVDKPSGLTSFRVVDHVRRQLVNAFPELDSRRRGSRPRGAPKPPRFKCGHAGTLDPLASGLLVVLVGKGSRLSPFLMGLDKTYAATIRFGAATDSLDRDGQMVLEAEVPGDPEALENVLQGFRGEILQVPPLISALKRDGKALYKRVRAGENVAEPDPRPVTIHQLDLGEVRWPADVAGQIVHEADLMVSCSSGTYIRSLARDLAQAAGTEGYIQELRRLQIGPFSVDDSLAGVMDLDGATLAEAMLPLSAGLPHVPDLVLDDAEAALVRQGGQPQPEWLTRLTAPPVAAGKTGPMFKMVTDTGELVALALVDPETVLPRTAVVIPAFDQDPGV